MTAEGSVWSSEIPDQHDKRGDVSLGLGWAGRPVYAPRLRITYASRQIFAMYSAIWCVLVICVLCCAVYAATEGGAVLCSHVRTRRLYLPLPELTQLVLHLAYAQG